MSPLPSDKGFTLVEVLVALGVFSVAALALITLINETTRGAAHTDMKFAAMVEADNQVILALEDVRKTRVGITTGETEQLGRKLEWERRITPAGSGGLYAIEVVIQSADSGQILTRAETIGVNR
jgi:general secretion pathway protein I